MSDETIGISKRIHGTHILLQKNARVEPENIARGYVQTSAK
jgi:hypothetical protein